MFTKWLMKLKKKCKCPYYMAFIDGKVKSIWDDLKFNFFLFYYSANNLFISLYNIFTVFIFSDFYIHHFFYRFLKVCWTLVVCSLRLQFNIFNLFIPWLCFILSLPCDISYLLIKTITGITLIVQVRYAF